MHSFTLIYNVSVNIIETKKSGDSLTWNVPLKYWIGILSMVRYQDQNKYISL